MKKIAKDAFDSDSYWSSTKFSYACYPTIRHRHRFVLKVLKKKVDQHVFIFDFGCGDGSLLKKIKKKYNVSGKQLGGCDISQIAVNEAQKKIHTPFLYRGSFPSVEKEIDIALCIEVIEHNKNYLDILKWIKKQLKPGGVLVLSTQAGKMYNSDIYAGHVVHFQQDDLTERLRELGFDILLNRQWGFPFFSLQKFLTSFRFGYIQKEFLEDTMSIKKRVIFFVTYLVYFIHNFIFKGPQLYIVAQKKHRV